MKKILATGAMLAYIAWFNSAGTVAAAMPEIAASDIQGPKHHQSARHEKSFEAKIARLATKLNVDPDVLAADIKSGKTRKEIMKEHGITANQLREVLGNTRLGARRVR